MRTKESGILRTACAAVAALALTGGCMGQRATAPGTDARVALGDREFDGWDVDRDGFVDELELTDGFGGDGYWGRYDRNRDGLLDDGEYGELGFRGIRFEDLDQDDDGFVNSSELVSGTFQEWDADDDGWIDRNEFGI